MHRSSIHRTASRHGVAIALSCAFIVSTFQPSSAVAQARGEDVRMVEVGVPAKGQIKKKGEFRLVQDGLWIWVTAPGSGNAQILLHYREFKRDANSVYLQPEPRDGTQARFPKLGSANLRIDLYLNKVVFEGSTHALGNILSASQTPPTPVDGSNVELVTVSILSNVKQIFRKSGANDWILSDSGGKTLKHYRETKRDEWSVYLQENSQRGLGKGTVVLDLFQLQATVSADPAQANKTATYRIIATDSSVPDSLSPAPIKLFDNQYDVVDNIVNWDTKIVTGMDGQEVEVTWTQKRSKNPRYVLDVGDQTQIADVLTYSSKQSNVNVKSRLSDERRITFDEVFLNPSTQKSSSTGYVDLRLQADITRANGKTTLAIKDESNWVNRNCINPAGVHATDEEKLLWDKKIGPYIELVEIKFHPETDAYWLSDEAGPKNLNQEGNYSHSQSFSASFSPSLTDLGGGLDTAKEYGSDASLKDMTYTLDSDGVSSWRLRQVYEHSPRFSNHNYVHTWDVMRRDPVLGHQIVGVRALPDISSESFQTLAYRMWESKSTSHGAPKNDFKCKVTYRITYRVIMLRDAWENLASLSTLAVPVIGPFGATIGTLANPNTYYGKLGKDWTSHVYVQEFDVDVVVPKRLLRPNISAPMLANESWLGSYARSPAQNKTHRGTISRAPNRQGVFVWQNEAGESWDLDPSEDGNHMQKREGSPHNDLPQGKSFEALTQSGRIIGFLFKGDTYLKTQ